MGYISDILFIISKGLMLPVILALLALLVQAIVMLAGLYSRRSERIGFEKWLKQAEADGFKYDEMLNDEKLTRSRLIYAKTLSDILKNRDSKGYRERAIADYEVEVSKVLGKDKVLLKLGPMLGLMGTLIPMGPALAGLAAGNIDAMAVNMQMAFATTVIGLTVAVVGVLMLLMDQRYYARTLNNLEYINSLISE